jgi:hypothetical protein
VDFVAGDREVEDVGTLVVNVVLELDASDRDAHRSFISRPVARTSRSACCGTDFFVSGAVCGFGLVLPE